MTYMKFIKKILIAFIILSIVAGVLIWIFTKNITHTAVKDLINKELATLTSQKSKINGEITWRFLPRPGIKITQLNIVDTHYTLTIDNLLFNLKIAPLIHGHLVFKEIKVDGLTANIRNLESQTNITRPDSIQHDSGKVQFAIDKFLLTRGNIVITEPKQKITLTGLELDATQLNRQTTFFPLQLKTALTFSTPQHQIKAVLDYDGKIRLDSSVLHQPYLALQNAGVNGQLLARNIRFNKFKLSKLNAKVLNKKGILTLNPLKMSLYSGDSAGDLTYQFSTKKLSINQIASNINANYFFTNIFGKTLVKGNLDLSVHGSINLKEGAWQDNASGSGNLTIKDGALHFIDLQSLADNASKKIHALPTENQNDVELALEQPLVPQRNSLGSTSFQLLSLQYQLKNALFISNSLLLHTSNIQLRGNGQINLNNHAITGNLYAILGTTDSMLNKIQQLLGGNFPLKLSGTLTQPEISPNARAINPILTRYMLKSALVYPVKQIKNQLETILLSPLLLAN